RHVGRRVDEGPLDAGLLGRLDVLRDPAGAVAQRRLPGRAQPVPERQRALGVGVDQQGAARGPARVRGDVRAQPALARAALARSKDYDVHRSEPQTSLNNRQIAVVLRFVTSEKCAPATGYRAW